MEKVTGVEEKETGIINDIYERYSQFSKIVVAFCAINLVFVESFIKSAVKPLALAMGMKAA